MNKCFNTQAFFNIFKRGLIVMHQMIQFDQAKTTPFISAAPTVAREGTNGLLVSGLPIPDSTRLEESILDRILLAYRKYLQYGSAEAKSKHDKGDFSDGGHYVMPICYTYHFTNQADGNTTQLHINFWLPAVPVPYISAGVPLPQAAKPNDTYDRWIKDQGRQQLENLTRSFQNKQARPTVSFSPSADQKVTDFQILWHDLERRRAATEAELDQQSRPDVPKGYRPMVAQEVTKLFNGYLDAIKIELEIFFEKVYSEAVTNRVAPDYYCRSYDYISEPNIVIPLCQ